jgi:transcriptional regulator with XRE-family HTH domain
MRDSREPAQANAYLPAEGEPLAESAPRVLAARLRAARHAADISQAALAEAMRLRGFNWRQTTVAKSEAGDRPVLFAEMVALSQIFKLGFDYFLFEGTELDSVVEEAARRARELSMEMAALENRFNAVNYGMEQSHCIVSMGKAISRFVKTGDASALIIDAEEAFARWRHLCLYGCEAVYEAVGLNPEKIKQADREALRVVATADQEKIHQLTEEQLLEESGEHLLALSDFLEGKEVDDGFIASLRDAGEWSSFMAGALLSMLRSTSARGQY